ncbi:MAG: hypothetical protein ABEK10_01365 [Candidatus Nanosalina sp.]
MFDGTETNPYVSFVQDDFYRQDGQIQVYMGKDSITRRMWDYEQNDLLRYVARWNPLGSEQKFLEDRGEVFGETLYTAYRDFLEDDEEVLICRERGVKNVEAEPGAAARETLRSLGRGSEREFYLSALKEIEKLSFTESVGAESEI